MRLFFILAGVALSLLHVENCFANHLTISNFSITATDTSSKRITFACDVNWENSWRSTVNNDATWVFLKYSTNGGQTWSHASMGASGTNPIGFNVPNNFEIIVPQDLKGFFLQRSDFGSGAVTARNVRFTWNYGQDGLSDETAMAANTINKIFGIEMVYIPTGSFYAGDGNSSSDYHFQQGSSDTDPWYVPGESAFSTTNSASDGMYYQSSGLNGENNNGDVFLVPSSFPKGYQGFYLMKYELTEGQWVNFFNTLSAAAKANRDITSAFAGGKGSDDVINRNTVSWNSNSPLADATTLRPYRPVSYISWVDLVAYADWAGLRPVTELEFEKAARGKDVAPVADEFAWGKTSNDTAEGGEITPSTEEDGTEVIFDSNSNFNRNSLAWSSGDGRAGGIAEGQSGPLRAGIFAEQADNRTTSGAGYYGNMELSGNLSEMIITVGRSQGRQFLGTHGDGQLATLAGYEGNATNIDWPGIDLADAARGVTGTIGSGYRGGDYQSSSIRAFQLSSRAHASMDADSSGKNQRYDASSGIVGGGRLGRTAP